MIKGVVGMTTLRMQMNAWCSMGFVKDVIAKIVNPGFVMEMRQNRVPREGVCRDAD
jgi:hypothetical protein